MANNPKIKEISKPYRITKSNASEYGKKGAIKSAEVRRNKRDMKETLRLLLNMGIKTGQVFEPEDIENIPELKDKNITLQDAICLKMALQASRGDVRSAEFVRDTAGYKPISQVENSFADVNIINDIPKVDNADKA